MSRLAFLRWFHGDLPELPPRPGGECWRLLGPEEAEDYLRRCVSSNAEERRMVDVALANGHWVMGAEVDGQMVGRMLLGRDWVYLPRPVGRLVRFPPGTCYYYDKFVEKPFRRRGIGASASPLKFRLARDLGLTRGCAAMLRSNRDSFRRWKALGFTHWDSLHLRLVGRLVWLMGKPWRRLGILELKEPSG